MFSIYDAESGEILRRITASAEFAQDQSLAPDEIVAEGDWDDRLFYFVDHTPTERPKVFAEEELVIAADGADAIEVSGVPAGTRVRHQGQEAIIDDGYFTFFSAVPGVYEFRFDFPFPFVSPQRVRITANAV